MKHLPWSEHLQSVVEYHAQYGVLPSDRSSDSPEKRPAIWLANQRSAYVNGTLSQERIDALDQAGLNWKQPTRMGFKVQLQVLKERVAGGGISTPSDLTKPSDTDLKSWLIALAKRSRKGELKAESKAALDRVLPGWDAPMQVPDTSFLRPIKPITTEDSTTRAATRRSRIRDEIHLLQAIAADRKNNTYERLTWFLDHHLGVLGRQPTSAEETELENYLTGPLDISLQYPLTTYVGHSSKGGIRQRDLEWIESALNLAQYRARLGRFPKQVGNREEYRKRFDQERLRAAPRQDVLQEELSDESIALYHWLHQQRTHDVNATLREDRSLFLHALIPDWNVRTRRRPFSETATQIARFVLDHHRWPANSMHADQDEKFLAQSLAAWRLSMRKGSLRKDREAALMTLFGESWMRAGITPAIPDQAAIRQVSSTPEG